ncbi:hypothetical protein [Microvirga arabica]|uniref:hypothetical protein n=1 Tax=Microvirga arabica TaxID=1128671 RepID=UPI00193A7C7B|nr:hypothetical protein [Microvirga arabica]MBM1170089.1 hypothetical protein [Microvirga arabica]
MAFQGTRWCKHIYVPKHVVDAIERRGNKGRIGLDEDAWDFVEWTPVPEGCEIHGMILSLGDSALPPADGFPPVEISGSIIPDRSTPLFAIIPAPNTPKHLRAVKITRDEALAQHMARQFRGEVLNVMDVDAIMARQRIALAHDNADKVFLDPEDARPPSIEEINPDFDPASFQRAMTGTPQTYGPGDEPF